MLFGWDEVVEKSRLAVVLVVKGVEVAAKNQAAIPEVEQIEGLHCGVRQQQKLDGNVLFNW